MTSQPGITSWLTNNNNAHIPQYLIKNNQTMKFGQLKQEKYFPSKIMQKMRQGD